FFLGTMGVHNFYSGNIVIGIIWLIVFGICCLLTLTGIGAFISVPILGLLEIIALIQAIVYVIK
ncbi:NINE protein, partial [bacterium]|nr:NINE protein [bacterium]